MAESVSKLSSSELRDRSVAELESLMQSKADELHQIVFKHALGQLRETHQLKGLRRDVARIKTLVHEMKASEAAQ